VERRLEEKLTERNSPIGELSADIPACSPWSVEILRPHLPAAMNGSPIDHSRFYPKPQPGSRHSHFGNAS
jgi:hypothetical protein